jgi:hypothetical protein
VNEYGEEASWEERWSHAFQFGHNKLRMKTWVLGRFAHAYADLTDTEVWTLRRFAHEWESGEFEPDSIGRYHHRSWFDGTEKRVA